MPSPARTVSRSIGVLERHGYTRQQAAHVIMDAVAAIGDSTGDFEPWAVNWLHEVWKTAQRFGAYYQQDEPTDTGATAPEQENTP